MIVRTLLKRGTDHPLNCEDDLFFSEYGDYKVGAVFDGCSTGMKSHFASGLMSKVLNHALKSKTYSMFAADSYSMGDIAWETFLAMFRKLAEIKGVLNLRDLEMVSTMILAIVKGDEMYCLISGDGTIVVDEEETKITSDDNAPDYMAYHLEKSPEEVYSHHLKKYGHVGFKRGVSISSDGIDSFRNSDPNKSLLEVNDFIFNDRSLISSEAMLGRKYNILLKEGFTNFDDLAVVRFII